jgi:hypothetical protein
VRSKTWLGRCWIRLKGEIIQDVPPSIDECESCREANCTQERWLRCARRLAAEAEQQYAREDCMPSATGRTDEMPGIFATDNAQDQAGEDETTESGDQRKRVSSSGDA